MKNKYNVFLITLAVLLPAIMIFVKHIEDINSVKFLGKELENNYIKGKRDFSSDRFYNKVNNIFDMYSNEEFRGKFYKIIKRMLKLF